jgi:hypothetical protein
VTRDDFRRRADLVREIPLEVVLSSRGAVRDRRDKSRWRTPRGPLSVTGTKFFHWHDSRGGGGAIDLAMHLGGWDAGQAVEWLGRHLGHDLASAVPPARASADAQPSFHAASPSGSASPSRGGEPPGHELTGPPACHGSRARLHLPTASQTYLPRVRRYLIQQRGLSATILASLIDQGKLYADMCGNAVFVMMAGKPNRPIGAELRGTGHRVWRGLAPGTCKNTGFFWIGDPDSQHIVLCESAIDAIRCFQLHTGHRTAPLPRPCLCISTAGVRSDAPRLYSLLARGYRIHCGFDTDEPGETASRQMIGRHLSIQRLRPPGHDWNDGLTAPGK